MELRLPASWLNRPERQSSDVSAAKTTESLCERGSRGARKTQAGDAFGSIIEVGTSLAVDSTRTESRGIGTAMSFVQSILRDGYPLGRICRIPITVNPSLIPIALILVAGIARGLEFGWASVPIAIVMVLTVFGSILVHELGHSLTARYFGIETRTINLHLFGGVAQIVREPSRPIEEFLIAAAGPMVSLMLAGLFALAFVPVGLFAGDTEVLQYVATPLIGGIAANVILGVFNLMPGFPMDGGRILRAYLWYRWDDRARATHTAATGGEIFGYALIAFGLFRLITLLDIGGVFTILVASFIVMLAKNEKRRAHALSWAASIERDGPNSPWMQESVRQGDPDSTCVEYVVRYPDGREVVFTREQRL